MEFKFVQMKGPSLFQVEIIMNSQILKSLPEPLGQFQPNLAQSIHGWRGFNFLTNEEPFKSQKGDTDFFPFLNQCYDIFICV